MARRNHTPATPSIQAQVIPFTGSSCGTWGKLEWVTADHDICISVMTEAEIRFGLARGKLSAATEAPVELFLSKIDILPWDPAAARATRLKSGSINLVRRGSRSTVMKKYRSERVRTPQF